MQHDVPYFVERLTNTEGAKMAATYKQWCQHYGYDVDSKEARADYQRYLDELAVFQRLAGRPA